MKAFKLTQSVVLAILAFNFLHPQIASAQQGWVPDPLVRTIDHNFVSGGGTATSTSTSDGGTITTTSVLSNRSGGDILVLYSRTWHWQGTGPISPTWTAYFCAMHGNRNAGTGSSGIASGYMNPVYPTRMATDGSPGYSASVTVKYQQDITLFTIFADFEMSTSAVTASTGAGYTSDITAKCTLSNTVD